ncbi:uncharacterized protein GGS22DRAFT_163415 [Annulohypoxylon maeteangense]|uniref:uncharacterized protein n=1 Tax=Annulohypoxylon maeteangense TaxID=1927788 RepID=UPI0020081A69|nr:uncharacterized protein GGS22DRAFT_163415 [Annulohypoxylon maeteangense]KAI0885313.1 hypothetical protein GGS22DRAFT_163415 [Annulohypoxylon maeteangense]
MSCSCRTTSLRVFIKSLTDLRLSHSTTKATGAIQPRYTRTVGLRSQFILTRPYTATAALGFPRRLSASLTWTSSSSPTPATPEAPEPKKKKRHNRAAVNQPNKRVLNTSPRKYEETESRAAILELSPESIDSLIAESEDAESEEWSPQERLPPNLKFGSTIHDESESSRKPIRESSRLKKLKIMGGKRREEVMSRPRAFRKEHWRIQKEALRRKFPEGWKPRKRLSPDALEGIRALNAQYPGHFTTEELSDQFLVSPEAIRRILRTNWKPSAEEEEDRHRRWFGRGRSIWSQLAALGNKPPRIWRHEKVVRDHMWPKRKNPRKQLKRRERRERRTFDEEVAQTFKEHPLESVVEDSNPEPLRDANEEFHQKMKERPRHHKKFMKGHRSFDKGHKNFNKDPNRKFNRDSGRKLNMDSNRDFVREPKKKADKVPDNRDAFEKAFDARFDPDSDRKAIRKSHF